MKKVVQLLDVGKMISLAARRVKGRIGRKEDGLRISDSRMTSITSDAFLSYSCNNSLVK